MDWSECSVWAEKEARLVAKESKERDPNGLNSKEPGSKLDAGKSPVMQGVLQYFPRALLEVGRVSQKGAEKYSWRGWEKVPDGYIRYGDALARHLISEGVEGAIDKDTGLLHAAQCAWNALARLEILLRNRESNLGEVGLRPGEWKEVDPGYFGKR